MANAGQRIQSDRDENAVHPSRIFGNKQEIILGDSKYEVLLTPIPLVNEWKIYNDEHDSVQSQLANLCALKECHSLHICALLYLAYK